MPSEVTHRTVETNGIRMHLAEAGAVPLVVLCHGCPELWYSWRHELPALAEAGEEFVVVGWSDPEGTRHRIGALLLGYYTPDNGKLIYAGRVGTGMPVAELERLYGRLQPLSIAKMPLSEPPPRGGRFGSPLVLSRVHWVRPEMVVQVSYVEMTPDGLLRHVVYLGEREDKAARDVHRDRP